jgi:hypothetical protein
LILFSYLKEVVISSLLVVRSFISGILSIMSDIMRVFGIGLIGVIGNIVLMSQQGQCRNFSNVGYQ